MSVVSNAADKSKRASRETFPSSKERRKSLFSEVQVGYYVRVEKQTESDCSLCLQKDSES